MLAIEGCGAGLGPAPDDPSTTSSSELRCAPVDACEEAPDAWPSIAEYRGWAPFDEDRVPETIVAPVAPLPLCALESGDQVMRWARDERGTPLMFELVRGGEVQLRATWEHDAAGMLTREVVEREERPVHVEGDGGRGETFVDGRPERVTTWSREPGGMLRESIDSDGDGRIDREVLRTLGEHGVTRRETRALCGAATREGLEARTWAYDAEGRTVAERCEVPGADEPRWSKRTSHGAFGPVRMEYERRDSFGARARVFQWTYDTAGRLVRDGSGAADGALDVWRDYEHELDASGRVSELRVTPHGGGRRPVAHRWTYDERGRRVDHEIREGAVTASVPRAYDAEGRLVRVASGPGAMTLRYECP